MYMLIKIHPTNENVMCGSLVTFLSTIFPAEVVASNYRYLDVLDLNADSRETIGEVLSELRKEYNIGTAREHLVVAGDAKTYQHLQSLKREIRV